MLSNTPDPAAPHSAIPFEKLRLMFPLAEMSPPGCFVELGVWYGGSAYYLATIAREQGRKLYLYDTFTGIPYQDTADGHAVGDFADTSIEAIKLLIPDAIIVPGIFPLSLIPMPPVAFVHVDMDQYRAIKDACFSMPPLMVDGGIMFFDDYNYNWLPNVKKAVDDIFGNNVNILAEGRAYVVVKKGEIKSE